MRVEIGTDDEVRAALAAGGLVGTAVQGLDLCDLDDMIASSPLTGAVFLGCRLGPRALARAQDDGALVFPRIDGLPFDAYRSRLYTPDELYEGFTVGVDSYERSLDARIDAWYREHDGPGSVDVLGAIAQRLHDHAISGALRDLLADRRVVGVMGGHKIRRDDPWYRPVADLGRRLQRSGALVLTGGGPGAMEAANLGAFMGPHPDDALDQALPVLEAAPSFDDRDGWLAAAVAVRQDLVAGAGESVGIPTWHYGHEPPNPFASHIAKYFQNSVREDGIVTVANAGIVFTPGGSGTVQEIFQDATQNTYARTLADTAPMVLLGREFWTAQRSAHRLLLQLAEGTLLEGQVLLTDDVHEAVELLLGPTP